MAMVLAAGFAMSASAEETTEATTEIATEAVAGDAAVIRIGSLKGPTSMGLVSLMQKAKAGETKEAYDFTMVTGGR